MDSMIVRNELHKFIDQMDEQQLNAIYSLIASNNNPQDQRRMLIMEERERYLHGEGASFSPEEIRQLAMNPGQRNGL